MVAGRKLLLADDSVTIQKVVELTFTDEGIEVTTFGNGAEAVEQLEQLSPDIVLADVFMPGMNGYEVCEHIKGDERFRHIPVMLLVGSFEPFDEAEARRVGADDFLTKPFQSIRQLVSKVGALLGGTTTEETEAPTRDLSRALAETKQQTAASSISREELERSTADTAPLPQHAARQWVEQQQQSGVSAVASASNQSAQEDTTQTMSVNNFGNTMETGAQETSESAQMQTATAPSGMTDAHLESGRPDYSYNQMQRTMSPFGAGQESGSGATRHSVTAVGLSDETLLELDDDVPYRGAAEADEFILDLQDEAFTMDTATLNQYEEEMKEGAPEAEEFVAAQLEAEEQRDDFAPVEEQSWPETFAPPAEEREEQPGAAAIEAEVEHESPAQESNAAGQITLEQLSPEVIDAIARRAVELLSARVVEEVAWEVVPQLAELLIKRRLEEERTKVQ